MRITDITVNFGRTIQPAQYESKKAEATISIVSDDEDSFLDETDADKAFTLAKRKVYEALGLTKAENTASNTAKSAEDKPAKEPAPKKRGRPKNSAKTDTSTDSEPAKEPAKEEATKTVDDVESVSEPEKPTLLADKTQKTITGPEMMSRINARMAWMRDHNVDAPSKQMSGLLKEWVNKIYPEDERDKAYTASVITNKIAELGAEKAQEFVDAVDKLAAK